MGHGQAARRRFSEWTRATKGVPSRDESRDSIAALPGVCGMSLGLMWQPSCIDQVFFSDERACEPEDTAGHMHEPKEWMSEWLSPRSHGYRATLLYFSSGQP